VDGVLDASDITGHNVDAVYIKQNSFLLIPPGCVFPYASTTAPSGYLLCNGSAVSRTTYAALFAVVGTTYGSGDGSTTFDIPNLVNRFIYGVSSGPGITGGSTTHTLTVDEMPSHSHSASVTTEGAHTHTYGMGKDDGNLSNNSGQTPPGDSDVTDYSRNTSSAGAHSHTVSIGSTGGGNSFSLMNPYMTMLYIIKY